MAPFYPFVRQCDPEAGRNICFQTPEKRMLPREFVLPGAEEIFPYKIEDPLTAGRTPTLEQLQMNAESWALDVRMVASFVRLSDRFLAGRMLI